jgi:DNA modification methylase
MGVENNPIIFNKDSRYLSEISDGAVDYVITSPPFNICHKYKTYHDSLDFTDFDDLLTTVIGSIERVLKEDGYFVIDIADVIVMERRIVYGAEFIKDKAGIYGLDFFGTFPYIALEGYDRKMKSSISRMDRKQRFHSFCEQVLVFGKSQSRRDLIDKFQIKPSYVFSNLRDSAFWPEDFIKDILAPFSLDGKCLLDPFMGSGSVGRLAMERGASFIGYDVDEDSLKAYGWI